MLRRHALRFARVDRPTVNFHCLWASCYQAVGESPPPEATHTLDEAKLDEWLDSEYAWVAVKRTAAAKVAQPLKLSHVRNQKLFEAESG